MPVQSQMQKNPLFRRPVPVGTKRFKTSLPESTGGAVGGQDRRPALKSSKRRLRLWNARSTLDFVSHLKPEFFPTFLDLNLPA